MNLLEANFPSVSDADELSNALTSTLQRTFESTHARNLYDADHRYRQNPPVLYAWERREGGDIVVTRMWVAVHVFVYPVTGPGDLTVKCQNREAGPITGDWWL